MSAHAFAWTIDRSIHRSAIDLIDRARVSAQTHTHTHTAYDHYYTMCQLLFISIARLFIRFVSFTHPFPVCYALISCGRNSTEVYWIFANTNGDNGFGIIKLERSQYDSEYEREWLKERERAEKSERSDKKWNEEKKPYECFVWCPHKMRQISPMEWQLMIVNTVNGIKWIIRTLSIRSHNRDLKLLKNHHYTITIALIRIGLSDWCKFM